MVKLKKKPLFLSPERRPGKIEVASLNPIAHKQTFLLAYSPGVAFPCLEIQETLDDAYKYTDKGNLVAVISTVTAVLGLGDIGAVMESSG